MEILGKKKNGFSDIFFSGSDFRAQCVSMGQLRTIHICCLVLVHYLPAAIFFSRLRIKYREFYNLGFGEQDFC